MMPARKRPSAFRRALPFLGQGGIGLWILFNWLMHIVWWTGEPLDRSWIAVAYGLLGLSLLSWWQTVARPVTAKGADWELAADRGEAPAEICKKTGLLKPPRSHYLHGELVLGLDHFCGVLGVPVAHHNRKFFVLFVGYSGALCLCSAMLAAKEYALLLAMPDDALGAAADGALSPLFVVFSPAMLVLTRVLTIDPRGPVALRAALAVIDFGVGILLCVFCATHLRNVCRNRTTIGKLGGRSAEAQYDLGWRANVRQVFGRSIALWLLPVWGTGPTVDGLSYPVKSGGAGAGGAGGAGA